jgi:outer membrane protein, heavy metal efflux system
MVRARLLRVLVAAVLSNSFLCAQADHTLSVDQLIETSLERNRDFLAAKQRLLEAQALLRQAGIRPAPTLEAEGATGRPLGTVGENEFTIGYFRPIETYGKRDRRIEVAQNNVDLAGKEIAERARQLTFDVKTRYIEAAAEQQKLKLVSRVLETNREYFRLTSARVERGDAAPLEADLFSTDLNRTEADQILSTGRAEAVIAELKQAVGYSPADTLSVSSDLPVPPIRVSLSELQERAKKDRPDLQSATLLVSQAEAELRLAQAEGRPDLTVSARYSHRNSQFDAFGLTAQGTLTPLRDTDNIITFGLSVPLFSSKQNSGNINAAETRLRAAELRRQHLESVVELEVESAYTRWTASSRAITILNDGVVNRARQNLQVVRQAYTLGQLRMFDVLNEQRRNFDTELSFIDAQAQAAKAVAELERAIGGKLQ